MTPRPIQLEFQAKSKWSRRGAADLLHRHGHRFDEELRREYVVDAYAACEKDAWFVPAAIQALVWSRHAQPKDDAWDEYVEECRRCFADRNRRVSGVAQWAGRFGGDGLARSLDGYRDLFVGLRESFEQPMQSPGDLRKNQELIMQAVMQGIGPSGKTCNVHGIGPWLGFAPHKIHMIWMQAWWPRQDSNIVYQPLGSVASRGLRVLAKAGIINEADARELQVDDDESDGPSGFGSVVLAHGLQQSLAEEIVGGRVMHINSALYELGFRGE